MDKRSDTRLLRWAKANKFLIGFIVLLVIALAVVQSLYASPLVSLGLLPQVILTVGLIWSVYVKRKGAILITLGIYSTWIAIVSWLTAIILEVSFLSIAIIFTILSAYLLYSGIKRYRNCLQKIADTASHPS